MFIERVTNIQDIPEVRFIPEVVVVGPDPTTGLLTRNFTVYYGVGNSTTGDATYTEGLLGSVSVQDPIDTLSVSDCTHTQIEYKSLTKIGPL